VPPPVAFSTLERADHMGQPSCRLFPTCTIRAGVPPSRCSLARFNRRGAHDAARLKTPAILVCDDRSETNPRKASLS